MCSWVLAFIKATEGLGNEDAYFQRNWKKSKNAGLVRGPIIFPGHQSGKARQRIYQFRRVVAGGPPALVLDIEQTYGVPSEKLRERAKEWLQTIQEYYHVLLLFIPMSISTGNS